MKLDSVLDSVVNLQTELRPDQALVLLQQSDPHIIEEIRDAADHLRARLNGEIVTYVINRNINFTNICEQHCSFCAFRRDEQAEGAYWLTIDQILAKAADAVQQGATEICMQGGLNPKAKVDGSSLAYYETLLRELKCAFPKLHIHAFSPQEIQFISRQDGGLNFTTTLGILAEAGLDSLPGTAAEVLDDRVRRIICPEKINTETWLEIVETAHQVGLPTTSTMLCGHIETPEQQITHFEQLRSLQKRAISRNYLACITEFILLPFVGESAPAPIRQRVQRDQPLLNPTLLLTAVARLFFGATIINHQPSWVKLGLAGATEALRWGCNDLGGTLMEEHITTMAGAKGGTCLTPQQLEAAIVSIQRQPQQRTTLYHDVQIIRNRIQPTINLHAYHHPYGQQKKVVTPHLPASV